MNALEMIADSGLPPLDGPEAVAETLVAVAHRSADWDVWGGARVIRYWDALTDRVRTCCYAGPKIADWWDALSRRMSLGAPVTKEERRAVAAAIACGQDRAVLDALSRHAEALVLRVRVANEARKEQFEARKDEAEQQFAPSIAHQEQLA